MAFAVAMAILVVQALDYPGFPDAGYVNCVDLRAGNNPTSRMRLHWNTTSTHWLFGIEAATNGWMSIGVNDVGGSAMNGADAFSAGVGSAGAPYVTDMYLNGFGACNTIGGRNGACQDADYTTTNALQPWVLVDSREDGGFTQLQFTRQMVVAVDAYDVDVTDPTSVPLVWSWNANDPSPPGSPTTRHDYAGSAQLNLQPSEPSMCAGAFVAPSSTLILGLAVALAGMMMLVS